MIQISDNTQQIQPSKIRKMFNKALEYDHVISFTLGEPDFTASPNVVEAGCRAIREGKTKYSENAGLLALRQAIAEYLHRTEGLSYDPASQIVVTPGAMGALFLALKVLLNPGDEVIVNEPCWTNYVQQIRMCGGVPVSVKTNAQRGFDLDVSAIAEAVTDKTKAIILNSPCNPTGAVASTETLLQLAELAQKQDLVILADEVYKHILFDGRTYTSFAALPGMKERTLVIDSLSKTYAMTGWRIGYAAGPENVIRNMVKLQENVSACAATPCQVAAIEALEGPQDHLKYMGTSEFLIHIVEHYLTPGMVPALVFLFGALISFSTGSSWGVWSIMMPIAFPMAVAFDISIPFVVGAVIGGGLFGDQCSPISDTTVLSSTGASCNHIVHVMTQIPYGITVGISAFVGFLFGGLTGQYVLSIAVTAAILTVSLITLTQLTKRRYPEKVH